MAVSPKRGLSISLALQAASFYVVLKYWPSGYALIALLLLMFVFTPFMFVLCLDAVRTYNTKPREVLNIGRFLFSLPLIALALLAFLVGITFLFAFGLILFSERFAEVVLSIPQIIGLLAMFILFGIGVLRVVFSGKDDNLLP